MKTINVNKVKHRIILLRPYFLKRRANSNTFMQHAHVRYNYNSVYEEYREFIKIAYIHWKYVKDINIFIKDIPETSYLKLLNEQILNISQSNLHYILVNSLDDDTELVLTTIMYSSNLDIPKNHSTDEIIENLKNSLYKTK